MLIPTDSSIERLFRSNRGRKQILDAIAHNAARRIDVSSPLRRVLIMDYVRGAAPLYDLDLNDRNVILPATYFDGEHTRISAKEERVMLPLFKIKENIPTKIGKNILKSINNISENIIKTIIKREDKILENILFNTTQFTNQVVEIKPTRRTPIKSTLDEVRYQAADIIPQDYFAYGKIIIGKDFMDKLSNTDEKIEHFEWYCGDLIHSSRTALYEGWDIVYCSAVPANTLYVCAEPEFVGVYADRKPLSISGNIEEQITAKIKFGVGIMLTQSVVRIYIKR